MYLKKLFNQCTGKIQRTKNKIVQSIATFIHKANQLSHTYQEKPDGRYEAERCDVQHANKEMNLNDGINNFANPENNGFNDRENINHDILNDEADSYHSKYSPRNMLCSNQMPVQDDIGNKNNGDTIKTSANEKKRDGNTDIISSKNTDEIVDILKDKSLSDKKNMEKSRAAKRAAKRKNSRRMSIINPEDLKDYDNKD